MVVETAARGATGATGATMKGRGEEQGLVPERRECFRSTPLMLTRRGLIVQA
jgi:hypothetical protein